MKAINRKQFVEAFERSKEVYFVNSRYTNYNPIKEENFVDLLDNIDLNDTEKRHFIKATYDKIYFDNKSVVGMDQIGKKEYFIYKDFYIFVNTFYPDAFTNGNRYNTIIYKVK